MGTNLLEFFLRLDDLEALKRFMADPDAVMRAAGLSESERALLQRGSSQEVRSSISAIDRLAGGARSGASTNHLTPSGPGHHHHNTPSDPGADHDSPSDPGADHDSPSDPGADHDSPSDPGADHDSPSDPGHGHDAHSGSEKTE